MSVHSWSKTLSLLGVTYEEAKVLRQHFEGRNRQIQQENLYLQEMQAKQLRALMRIDNSDLKAHKVPSQLVFRKTSRQFARRLRDSIRTDYLLCQAKDLLLARKFLSKRGLDPRYAGEWNNDFVYLPKSQNEEQEMFEWKDNYHFGENPGPEEEHVSDIASSPPIMDEQSLRSQADSINDLGDYDVASFRGYQGHPPSTYRVPMSNSYSNETRNHMNHQACGIVRLRIGSEQAARVRDLEQPSEWTGLSNHYITRTEVQPLRQRNSLDSNGQHAFAETSRNHSRKLPVAGDFELPVRRVMGGQWSYSSLEPKLSSMPTSSLRYRGKPEKVRRETQMQQAEENAGSVASTAENIENAVTSQSEDRHGNNSSTGIQSSSQQNNEGTSSVTEMPPSSDTCIPEMSFANPVISLDSKVQTKSAFPSTDTNFERHSTPIRNISVQDSEYRPQPARIAASSDDLCYSAEGKQKLEDSLLSVVKPSASGPTIENSLVDEKQDEGLKFQAPAVDSRSTNEKTNGEDAEPKIKEHTNVDVLMHSEEAPSKKVEAQPSSLVLDHAHEEEKKSIMHEYSPSLTAPELSGGGNSIHMESTQSQDSKTSDERVASHSSSGNKTVQEGSPTPKFDSTEQNGNEEDSEISKTTNTKSSTSLTKPKAPSKKTTAIGEQRRSVRLNGPPKKQTLRKRK